MIYRIKYTKTGDIKYISHLDIIKLMERIFRRAHVEVAYSEGFNPHPRMSFSPALQLGIESISEFVDVELKEKDFDDIELLNKLNQKSVPGIEFIQTKILSENSKKSTVALISHSEYEGVILGKTEDISEMFERIEQLEKSENIAMTKQSKNGNVIAYNLSDFVVKFSHKIIPHGISLNMIVHTSSSKYMNPKVIIDYILKDSEKNQTIRIKKTNAYTFIEESNKYIELMEI